eukprot:TRINITY_DN5003_c0_g2_i13.p1 TRINITY_DN5003_c0_g2~~TRINITY_DN5003_c0_g2_i13.p1  ORF type:complete len:360 (-),score=12.46 TRINITY_DN5003_c0_g2_i13:298-1377(-)
MVTGHSYFALWILVVSGFVKLATQQSDECKVDALNVCDEYFDCSSPTADQESCLIDTLEIIKGVDASRCRYPYVVSLQQLSESSGKYQHFCGGVLLDKQLILTAAHCIWNAKEDNRLSDSFVGYLKTGIKVAYGAYCRHGEGLGRVDAIQYFIHNDYQASTGPLTGSDLAIIKVSSEMSGYGDTPTARRDYWTYQDNLSDMEYTEYTILGWGFMNFDEAASPSRFREAVVPLQQGTVKMIDIQTCNSIIQEIYPQVVVDGERMICARDDQQDTCKGDSGGPLIYEDNKLSPFHDLLVGFSWSLHQNFVLLKLDRGNHKTSLLKWQCSCRGTGNRIRRCSRFVIRTTSCQVFIGAGCRVL